MTVCPICNGRGSVYNALGSFYEDCGHCQGTGKVRAIGEPMTNEEGFCTLSTEKKAKVMARICVGAADDCDKGKTGKLYAPYWRRWLREEYRGNDFKIN